MMIVSAALLLMMVPTLPTGQGPRRAKPLQPLEELISPEDYPVDAVIRQAEGRTRFELAIDEGGTPFACRILESAKEPSLDRVTCDVFIARARFEPAVDAKGRAVADTYRNVVNWRLPNGEKRGLPFGPSRTIVSVHSDSGRVSHCDMREIDYVWPRLTRDQCLVMMGREVIDMVEYFRMPTMTVVTTFDPHGRTPEKDEQDYGLLAREASAAVRIAPDGRVEHCQAVSFRAVMDLPRLSTRPDLCDSRDMEGLRFVPAGDPEAVRSGRWTTRFYIGHDIENEKEPEPAR